MSRHNRVTKLERVRRPKTRPPCVVVIRNGETGSEAIDRVEVETGARPFRPIGVPAFPQSDEERIESERRFERRQIQCLANAKASRPKEVSQ